MLLRQLSWSAGLGMALGITGGMLVARVFESLISLRWTDGFAYAAALLVFVATAGIAALLPALRALRADLLQALRYE